MTPMRLGVNVDHIATVRNARGGTHPDPVAGALVAEKAGADGITAHLREDRRHIRDDDIRRLKEKLAIPLNLEMAVTEEMVGIALATRPHACCLVPEKRTEVTTEGGLDVKGAAGLADTVARLADGGIRVSLFIDPDVAQVEAAHRAGAPVVELHTGSYCEATATRPAELARIEQAAEAAEALGLECHAGHGLTFDTVGGVAAIPTIAEFNIGHFLIGEAITMGLAAAITEMRRRIVQGRLGQ
ncbi:pyridoxine 5'-phosphate synthase [Acuticoccus mangrovi]|uniref:Pyridoxine 5'-phosphate synthase n=1 Tax=Acuticoccus mangrovi TaxID=2796142 RepID=A0A934IT97_9HYPH|nr:pyridoxine 5'-phosphate synthase [Acuticoccus mangrovi]MBJ3777279.1 pyridoxine 5'-phosphate synthase [Acuticoccus mangrovi]